MPKYKGQEVKVRELDKNDSRNKQDDPQVVVIHNDGREEVVSKSQVTEAGGQGQQSGQHSRNE